MSPSANSVRQSASRRRWKLLPSSSLVNQQRRAGTRFQRDLQTFAQQVAATKRCPFSTAVGAAEENKVFNVFGASNRLLVLDQLAQADQPHLHLVRADGHRR